MVDYTPEIAEKIGNLLSEGLSMREILLRLAELGIPEEDIPSRSTIQRWQLRYPEFDTICARARLLKADIFNEKIEMAVDEIDEDNANAMKVKIGALQWLAARHNPKRYGDKTTLVGDAENPLEVVHKRVVTDL